MSHIQITVQYPEGFKRAIARSGTLKAALEELKNVAPDCKVVAIVKNFGTKEE